MKNAFYFILKALFILKIFKFLSWIFGHIEKTAWIEITLLISKSVMSQPGKQRITTYILLNISQIKGNQTLKFGQLIEHCKIIFFSLKIMQKLWETSSRPLFAF